MPDMRRRTRHVPDSPVLRELEAAVEHLADADQRLTRAIIEAAREAAKRGNPLTYAEIGRRAGFTREYVSRLAKDAGIVQERKAANTTEQD